MQSTRVKTARRNNMTAQPARKEEDRNPRTIEQARTLVAYVESLFMPWNIDALVAGFTEDCVVRFGAVPEFRGMTRFGNSSRQEARGKRAIVSGSSSAR
jgi:hypothetical protein